MIQYKYNNAHKTIIVKNSYKKEEKEAFYRRNLLYVKKIIRTN